VLRQFSDLRNRAAVRVVERIPERDGVLDSTEVDRSSCHVTLRDAAMSEEFQHGRRVGELLDP
jgi:hypothetical protein